MSREFVRQLFHWSARVSTVLILLLVVAIFLGERFDPEALGVRESLLFLCFLVLVAGLAVGWIRERLGGGLILGAWVAFYALNLAGSGHLPSGWAFPVLLVPGVLFLISDWMDRRRIEAALA